MDLYGSGAHKYPDTQGNQPGLEVGTPRLPVEQSPDWPDASKPVWGLDRIALEEKFRSENRPQILGLSVGVFWGIVVLLCVLLAGGVGGGVGAGLAARKNTCSSVKLSSNTATSSANAEVQTCTAPTTTIIISAISGSAPSSTVSTSVTSISAAPSSHCTTSTTFNGSSLHPLDASGNPIQLGTVDQTFEVLCNTNFPGGPSYGNPGVHDIMKMYQPDLLRCVAACAEYNAGYQSNVDGGVNVGGGLCKAVSLVLAPGEFCYLKNGTGVNDTSTSGGDRIDSAVLE